MKDCTDNMDTNYVHDVDNNDIHDKNEDRMIDRRVKDTTNNIKSTSHLSNSLTNHAPNSSNHNNNNNNNEIYKASYTNEDTNGGNIM
jgi:hypothetical protein